MLEINIVCVGKLKESWLISAQSEYKKRLTSLCKINITELAEERLPQTPSEKEVRAALSTEAEKIRRIIPAAAYAVALCVEGECLSSEDFSKYLEKLALSGVSKIYFIIGGSFGLSEDIKSAADYRLSISRMTFPHHLARVLLLEQLYRVFFSIQGGGKYHK